MNFEKEPLKITLYYDDKIILSEKIEDADDILNKVYRVSKKIKGNYKVVVNSNHRSYMQDFNI